MTSVTACMFCSGPMAPPSSSVVIAAGLALSPSSVTSQVRMKVMRSINDIPRQRGSHPGTAGVLAHSDAERHAARDEGLSHVANHLPLRLLVVSAQHTPLWTAFYKPDTTGHDLYEPDPYSIEPIIAWAILEAWDGTRISRPITSTGELPYDEERVYASTREEVELRIQQACDQMNKSLTALAA